MYQDVNILSSVTKSYCCRVAILPPHMFTSNLCCVWCNCSSIYRNDVNMQMNLWLLLTTSCGLNSFQDSELDAVRHHKDSDLSDNANI
jgi:hypothetical protein